MIAKSGNAFFNKKELLEEVEEIIDKKLFEMKKKIDEEINAKLSGLEAKFIDIIDTKIDAKLSPLTQKIDTMAKDINEIKSVMIGLQVKFNSLTKIRPTNTMPNSPKIKRYSDTKDKNSTKKKEIDFANRKNINKKGILKLHFNFEQFLTDQNNLKDINLENKINPRKIKKYDSSIFINPYLNRGQNYSKENNKLKKQKKNDSYSIKLNEKNKKYENQERKNSVKKIKHWK